MQTDHENPVSSKFLKKCGIDENESEDESLPPFSYMIFGGYGDLSQRKIFPALLHIFLSGAMPDNFEITGIGRKNFNRDSYREFIRDSINMFCLKKPDKSYLEAFISHVDFFQMDLGDTAGYTQLKKRLHSISNSRKIIFYLAVPPDISPEIITNLGVSEISSVFHDSRIIIEKPFGEDRSSAVRLNDLLLSYFQENRIYRMDHYLGKETVQNILYFRFANSIFEPLWNSKYIDNMQITAAETIGIGHRGKFYDRQGIIRDIIQNHMMQLVSLIAMEAPAGIEAGAVRDEKLKIFRAIRPVTKNELDLFTAGQYGPGELNKENVTSYRNEEDVPPDSITPTFISGRFFIDTWRWAGVPFYFKAGKRLNRQVTEIVIQFRQPPLRMFGRACDPITPNILVFTIQPREEIVLKIGIKEPGKNSKVHVSEMKFSYKETFGMSARPSYERQVMDSISGDLTLFASQDSIEAMWDIVDPIIKHFENISPDDFPNYSAGSHGPAGFLEKFHQKGLKWHTV